MTEFVRVPRKPTPEMIAAGKRAVDEAHASSYGECPGVDADHAIDCYRAMLAAAPTPEPNAEPEGYLILWRKGSLGRANHGTQSISDRPCEASEGRSIPLYRHPPMPEPRATPDALQRNARVVVSYMDAAGFDRSALPAGMRLALDRLQKCVHEAEPRATEGKDAAAAEQVRILTGGIAVDPQAVQGLALAADPAPAPLTKDERRWLECTRPHAAGMVLPGADTDAINRALAICDHYAKTAGGGCHE